MLKRAIGRGRVLFACTATTLFACGGDPTPPPPPPVPASLTISPATVTFVNVIA
ncbi:MAG: hypothetical protein OXK77_15600 [Gemmatimonadota bacterium]|nr:hypothetical protein [Gammaproteobacteria bacterium]MDE2784378.1 hypothetical protein [Gemmatimonadota bacterium]